jgi:hypothetical protein
MAAAAGGAWRHYSVVASCWTVGVGLAYHCHCDAQSMKGQHLRPRRTILPASAYAAHSARSRSVLGIAEGEELLQRGVVVIDGVLSAAELRACATELQRVRQMRGAEEGGAAQTGVGGFGDNRQKKSIRSDRVLWLHEDDCVPGQAAGAAEGASSSSSSSSSGSSPHLHLPALREVVLLMKGLGASLEAAAPGAAWQLEIPTRCMLSLYNAGGSRYRAHRDTVGGSFMEDEGGWLADREQADRELTAILYLNEDWPAGAEELPSPKPNPEFGRADGSSQTRGGGEAVGGGGGGGLAVAAAAGEPPDWIAVPRGLHPPRPNNVCAAVVAAAGEPPGGELRCFLDAGSADGDGRSARTVLDVAPLGGRLVIFRSRQLLHAVMPCWRPRYALSCWLLQDPMSKLGFLDSK